MTDISAHDWFRPKLEALMAEASADGIAADVSVAVITDLVNGPLAAGPPVASADEGWNRDIGEPEGAVNAQHPSADAAEEPDPLFGHQSMGRVSHGRRHWSSTN